MPAAFHLGKFPDEGLSAAVEVIHDGFALCIEAQAGFALAIGGNSACRVVHHSKIRWPRSGSGS